jgi:hypothetical protein
MTLKEGEAFDRYPTRLHPRLGPGSGSPAPSPVDGPPRGPYITPRVSPDGRRVVILRAAREMLEVDVTTGKVLRTLRDADHTAMIASPAYAAWGLFVLGIRWRGNLWVADVSP